MTSLPVSKGIEELSRILLAELRSKQEPHTSETVIKKLVRRANHSNELPIYGWPELVDRFHRIASRGRWDTALCIRHGTTKYNIRNLVSGQHDTVLAPPGVRQAQNLTTELPNKLDLIVCSAMSRTIQTMAISIPQHVLHSTLVFLDPRLNEVNLGKLQGRRRVFLPQFEEGNIDYAPQKGESYRKAARRIFSSIADIFDYLAECSSNQSTAAIFCHAGVIRILSTLTRQPASSDSIFHVDVYNAGNVELSSGQLNLPNLWLNKTQSHAKLTG